MPVTFGTVQLIPAPNVPPSTNGAATPAAAAPPPDSRDLGPLLSQLHDRAARVRAH
jgi:hypothetical protein